MLPVTYAHVHREHLRFRARGLRRGLRAGEVAARLGQDCPLQVGPPG